MTTLETVSKRIKRIIDGSRFKQESPLDVREVADTVRDVIHYLMKGRWYEIKQDGETYLPSQYIASFDCDVKSMTKRGTTINYVDLPAIPIELPMDLGVQRVGPVDPPNSSFGAFIPVPTYFRDIYGDLRSGLLEHQIGYELIRDKIYFTKLNGKNIIDLKINKVEVDLAVVSPTDTGLKDPLPCPPEMIEDIVKITLERYSVSPQAGQNAQVQETPNVLDQ